MVPLFLVITNDCFENFNKNAEINKEAAADFRGIFNYINLGDSGLGSTTAGRTKTLKCSCY